MKVLYISYDGMTDSLGQSQVLPYLRELSKKGCEFHIVSLEKKAKFEHNEQAIQDYCDDAKIQWHPLAYKDKAPVFSAFFNYKRLKIKAISLHKDLAFDIAHCRSDIPGIIGHHLQQKMKVKFLFDMRGFWADERVEGGIWNTSNPIFTLLYGYFKKKESTMFRDADGIISLTKKGKGIIQNMPKLKAKQLDITVIPCCVDLQAFSADTIDQVKREHLKKTLKIDPKTTVFGYLGSIGTWYMLDEMLEFYAIQRKKLNPCVFLFVSGESPQKIYEKGREYDIPESEIIVTSSSHAGVPLHISLFDYSLFFIRPTFSKSASSPTKQGELMAMKVPIICNSGVGDTDEIIRRFNAGSVLPDLTRTTFDDWNPDTMKFDPKDSRAGAEEWFSLQKGAESYFEVYQRMLSNT